MALRTFETADAKYYLGLGRHDTSSAPIFEDVNLKSLDFLVLETGKFEAKDNILDQVQDKELCLRIRTENPNAPIYSVDYAAMDLRTVFRNGGIELITGIYGIPTSLIGLEMIREGKVISGTLLSLGGAILASHFPANRATRKNSKQEHFSLKIHALKTTLLPTVIGGFRDAVAAKKISEYLVPKHQHQDGSKVQVGILYGGMHSGIELKIRNPWIADATLWMYHDLFRYGDTEKLNEVREIVPGQEDFIKYNCGLFK